MPAKPKAWSTSADAPLFHDFPISTLEQCCFITIKWGQDNLRFWWNARTIICKSTLSKGRGVLYIITIDKKMWKVYQEMTWMFLAGIVDSPKDGLGWIGYILQAKTCSHSKRALGPRAKGANKANARCSRPLIPWIHPRKICMSVDKSLGKPHISDILPRLHNSLIIQWNGDNVYFQLFKCFWIKTIFKDWKYIYPGLFPNCSFRFRCW